MAIAVGNVTSSATTVYTSTGNTVITFLSLCNYSGSDVLANVFVVPNGSSAGNTNIVIASLVLTANAVSDGDTYQFYQGNEKLILGNGDTIQVSANADNRLTTVTSYTSA
jgi:hypothetical protein